MSIRLKPATSAIVRAITLLGSAQGLGMLCSLIRNKLVTLWVGPAGVAVLGILTSLTEMASAVAQQGIRTSSVPAIARAKDDGRLSRVMSAVMSWGVAVGVASAAILLMLSPLLSRLSFGSLDRTWMICILAIAVIFNAFIASRQAIAQGTGALPRLARASLIGSVGGLLISLPLIYFLGVDGMAWVIVTYSAVTAIAFLFPRLAIPRLTLRATRSEGLGFLRLGLWITLSSIVDWGTSYLLISWLMTHGGDYAAALYQSGYTVAFRYMGILFSAVAMEFYPRLALASERIARSPRHPALLISHEVGVVLRIAIPAAALLILLARPVMILLYSEELTGAIPYMVGALAATPLRALSWCVAFTIISRGDGRAYLLTEAISGVTCLSLSIAGYHLYGLEGMGVAFILWYLVYTATVIIVCRRLYNLRLPRATIVAALLSTLLLIALALLSLTLNSWLLDNLSS